MHSLHPPILNIRNPPKTKKKPKLEAVSKMFKAGYVFNVFLVYYMGFQFH